MTLEQTAELMDLLLSEYPHLFTGKDECSMETKLTLWAGLFVDDDPALVFAAVKALLVSTDKSPTVASVKSKMRQLSHPGEMTEAEAWNTVYRAITNSAYQSRREFERLPPTLRRLVGSPRRLYELSQMEPGVVQSVEASHFQRSYRAAVTSERGRDMLPPDVRALADRLGQNRSLKGGLSP